MTHRTRVVGDVSGLPDYAFGLRSLIFWGVMGFMAVEGTAFLLAAGTYLYLRGPAGSWPPEPIAPPDLLWGTVFTIVLVLSEIPNRWLNRQACNQRAAPVRWGTVLMTVLGLVLIGLRALEFPHLNVRWDANAYGSATWLLMVLHTAHVITDLADTAVVMVWLFTHEIRGAEYSDVSDYCAYWTFVVVTWLPLYALVYWAPRVL
jgi:heme/copper-type cytochrome/quinol oxidase subunit 3